MKRPVAYLAGTGRGSDREKAFLRAVFARLTGEQDHVCWTPEALAEEEGYHRLAWYGYLLLGVLVAVVLVVPAATVRLVCDRLAPLQAGAVALAAAEGVAAVYLADALNVGAGPALAVLGGGVFAVVAGATAMRARAVPA